MTLQELVGVAVERLGSQSAVARQIGVTPSHISRVLDGKASFEVGNCLRLAKIVQKPASEVLLAAGKEGELSLIEEFYGKPRRVVTNEEWDILDALRELPQTKREAVIDYLELQVNAQLSASTSRTPAKPPRKSSR